MFDIVTPDLIVAQDASIAQKLESCMNEGQDNTPRLILEMPSDGSSSSSSSSSWQSLDTMMQNSSDSATLHDLSINRTSDDVILVLMTSGNTSLPKGCPHTNRSTTSCIRAYNAGGCYNRTRSLCSHLPISHIFAINSSFSFHMDGLPVVHASHFFEPRTTLQAIREERTTDFAGVPAVAGGLIDHPDFAKTDTSCMRFIVLGATTVTPATVERIMENFGNATKVANGYGMTEGAPSVMTRYDEIPDGPPERVSSGYVLPGCKHRVVDPETGRVVPRGTAGELYMGGSLVIREYWTGSSNKDTSDSFVEDEQGKWVKTGDQAIMDEDGSIEIVGRYKHLIIRGKCSLIISARSDSGMMQP